MRYRIMEHVPVPELLISVAILLVLSGCGRVDRLYRLDALYQEDATRQENGLVDPSLIPDRWKMHATRIPDSEDGVLTISLEQAVLLGLKRSSELRVQEYQPVIAGTFAQLERGRYDPELFAELAYSEETASETARSTGERFRVEAQDVEAAAGLRQRWPAGTDVSVSIEYGRSTSNRTPEQQEARLGLTVTQALLRGMGPAVNLVDIRQAEMGARVSFYEFRGFVEALTAEVEAAYWQYVLAEEGIAIFEHSLDTARKQLSEVEKRIEVGMLPRNAAAAARAEAARRKQALIEAQSNLEEKRVRLLRLLNAAGKDQFSLAIKPSSRPETAPDKLPDPEERVELAGRMRPDLNEAKARLQQNRLEVVRTQNGLLPKLDLFIQLGKTGYAESFGDAFKDLDNDSYDFAAGISFSHFIGNREARAKDLAARASSEQAEAAVANLRSLVELDVRLALNEIDRARQQIEAGGITRKLQEQTLAAEQERFAVGDSTSLLVAQAQRDLLVSQLDEIRSIVEYRIALINLYRAEGSLLERRGIRLEQTL